MSGLAELVALEVEFKRLHDEAETTLNRLISEGGKETAEAISWGAMRAYETCAAATLRALDAARASGSTAATGEVDRG